MKLKLTMTNAETGEVLHEETDLNFAMMCFGRKTEEGIDFQAVTRGENMTAADFAHCLAGVDNAVEKKQSRVYGLHAGQAWRSGKNRRRERRSAARRGRCRCEEGG